MVTHTTVRAERGLPYDAVAIDDAAPLHYTRKDTPPLLVIAGDHDLPGRAEENQLFVGWMKGLGNERVRYQQIADRDHTTIVGEFARPNDPVRRQIVSFIQTPAATDPAK